MEDKNIDQMITIASEIYLLIFRDHLETLKSDHKKQLKTLTRFHCIKNKKHIDIKQRLQNILSPT